MNDDWPTKVSSVLFSLLVSMIVCAKCFCHERPKISFPLSKRAKVGHIRSVKLFAEGVMVQRSAGETLVETASLMRVELWRKVSFNGHSNMTEELLASLMTVSTSLGF